MLIILTFQYSLFKCIHTKISLNNNPQGGQRKAGHAQILTDINLRTAWYKQMTDIERQQNGGMIERRPNPDIA